jgi:hypothetical protein
MRQAVARTSLLLAVLAVSTACAYSLRSASVADLRNNPGRYQHRTVSINGVVTNAYSVPFMPYQAYRVDDGTGEVTVLSQNRRTPTRGAHVRVKGKIEDVAVFGGQSLGLHLREEDLYVK